MSDQIIKAATEVVKSPLLLKQVVILISGLVFVIFIYNHTDLDPLSEISHLGFGSIEKSFVVLAVSYVAGRLLIMLARIFNGLLGILSEFLRFVLNPQSFTLRWRRFVVDMKNPTLRNKRILRFVTGHDELESKSPADLKHELTIVDYARIIQKYPTIDNQAELTLTSLEFTRILLGASLVFSYVISSDYILLVLLLLWLQEKLQKNLEDTNYALYFSAVKYSDRLNEL